MASVRIRFVDTLIPLFVASVGAAGLVAAYIVVKGGDIGSPLVLLFLMWPLWLISLAAEITLVVPLLLVIPALRKPPIWVAMIWGAGVGFAFAFMFGRVAHLIEPRVGPFMAVVGAPAGLAYAVTARWLCRARAG